MKILVIEDAPNIVETISLALGMRWPEARIIHIPNGLQGIEMVNTESPDVVILDLGLPDISGFEVLKRIRSVSDVPVLVLTVMAEESDIVKGLEWGADDYMVKPFKQLELLARIKGIIRRRGPVYEKPLVYGQLRLEPVSMRLTRNGKDIRISRTEGLVLACLMQNGNSVTPYAHIARAMWGTDFPEAGDSIKVHIHHLRQKLEDNPSNPQLILNKPRTGYFLSPTLK